MFVYFGRASSGNLNDEDDWDLDDLPEVPADPKAPLPRAELIGSLVGFVLMLCWWRGLNAALQRWFGWKLSRSFGHRSGLISRSPQFLSSLQASCENLWAPSDLIGSDPIWLQAQFWTSLRCLCCFGSWLRTTMSRLPVARDKV